MDFLHLQKGLCVSMCFCFIFLFGVIVEATDENLAATTVSIHGKEAIATTDGNYVCLTLPMLPPVTKCYYRTTVSIDGKEAIATTDENYVCATLDLWPDTKCNYGDCPWGKSSFLNVDLNNKILKNAVKAFKPLRLRLGGTLQDKLIYQAKEGDKLTACDYSFVSDTNKILDFTHACLSLDRWDEINSFIMETGAETVFGLNALRGKTIETKEFIYENGRVGENTIATGEWDSSNSEFLIRYTVDKGYKIHGWTLGNELGGHTLFIGVSAKDYTADTKKLHELLEGIYKKYNSKPLIIAPGAIFDDTWYKEYIDQTPELHAATHHMYNLGAGDSDKLADTILTASFFDEQTRNMFRDLQNILKETGGKTVAWIGESGGAFNSGKDGISNTFINGFWYLNMLGFAAIHDTKTYCRQTLTGGNYGLLGTDTLIPNPDYYSALLWHRLMGKKVLKTEFKGMKNVYAYAHCAKESTGITILLLNQDGKSSVKASFDSAIYGTTREEYRLTPLDENIRSRNVMLNGKLLYVGPSGVIPSLEPDKKVNSKDHPIEVAPYSIMFVHMPGAKLTACGVK